MSLDSGGQDCLEQNLIDWNPLHPLQMSISKRSAGEICPMLLLMVSPEENRLPKELESNGSIILG
jgi:hypothetical protein